uniref:Uncharacterized protein n=1 Tax=Setaria digitata TaxID=48799 RepID=A0A915PFH9_9BILA
MKTSQESAIVVTGMVDAGEMARSGLRMTLGSTAVMEGTVTSQNLWAAKVAIDPASCLYRLVATKLSMVSGLVVVTIRSGSNMKKVRQAFEQKWLCLETGRWITGAASDKYDACRSDFCIHYLIHFRLLLSERNETLDSAKDWPNWLQWSRETRPKRCTSEASFQQGPKSKSTSIDRQSFEESANSMASYKCGQLHQIPHSDTVRKKERHTQLSDGSLLKTYGVRFLEGYNAFLYCHHYSYECGGQSSFTAPPTLLSPFWRMNSCFILYLIDYNASVKVKRFMSTLIHICMTQLVNIQMTYITLSHATTITHRPLCNPGSSGKRREQ